jgi:hypothetical protein
VIAALHEPDQEERCAGHALLADDRPFQEQTGKPPQARAIVNAALKRFGVEAGKPGRQT